MPHTIAQHDGIPLAEALALDLRRWRLARGWRQVDLAAAAGVSQTLISRMECGGGGTISLDVWERVGTALRANLEALFWPAVPTGTGPDLRSRMADVAAGLAREGGWTLDRRTERRSDGSVLDVRLTLWDPERPRAVVVRVWAHITGVDALIADLDRTMAESLDMVAPAQRGGLVVLHPNAHIRRRLTEGRKLLDARFPQTGSRWTGVLRRRPGQPLPPDGLLWVDRSISRLVPTRLHLARRWDRGGYRVR